MSWLPRTSPRTARSGHSARPTGRSDGASFSISISFVDDDGVRCDDGDRDEPRSSDESNDGESGGRGGSDHSPPTTHHPPLTTTSGARS